MAAALEAGQGDPLALAHVQRAVALATFSAADPEYGPAWGGELSTGVPERPVGPLLPSPRVDALEALLVELVWAADCAEFTDARNNAAQYLRAAGSVVLAHQVTLARRSPGLGLVLVAP